MRKSPPPPPKKQQQKTTTKQQQQGKQLVKLEPHQFQNTMSNQCAHNRDQFHQVKAYTHTHTHTCAHTNLLITIVGLLLQIA